MILLAILKRETPEAFYIANYINTELSKIKSPHKIVIVNNSSSIESNKFFNKELRALPVENSIINTRSDIFLLSPDSNLGYAKANNLGAKFLMNRFSVKHLLFSNTDIEIQNGEDIDLLLKSLHSSNKIGGVGPRVIGKKGEDQSPHPYIPFYRYFGWFLFKPLKGKISSLRMKSDKSEKVNGISGRTCYWVSGCFMLVKAQNFIEVGMFDAFTFLYCEEKILAERFLKNGQQFYFEPAVVIRHNQDDNQSDKRKKEIANMIFNNDCYYYKIYRGVSRYMIWLIRLIRRIQN